MPPLSTKGKGKAKDGRQSRSRNTTPSSVPSSVVSGPVSTDQVSRTAYLEIPKASLNVLTSTSYDDILEKYKAGVLPDAQQIIALATDVRILADAAATRSNVCDGGMRELSARRREKLEEEQAQEQAAREAEEKETQRRLAAEEAEAKAKLSKPKKKQQQQKERSRVREERPLTHGAHGVARQDGLASLPSGKFLNSHSIQTIASSLARVVVVLEQSLSHVGVEVKSCAVLCWARQPPFKILHVSAQFCPDLHGYGNITDRYTAHKTISLLPLQILFPSTSNYPIERPCLQNARRRPNEPENVKITEIDLRGSLSRRRRCLLPRLKGSSL